jgi:hypothetical protein
MICWCLYQRVHPRATHSFILLTTILRRHTQPHEMRLFLDGLMKQKGTRIKAFPETSREVVASTQKIERTAIKTCDRWVIVFALLPQCCESKNHEVDP